MHTQAESSTSILAQSPHLSAAAAVRGHATSLFRLQFLLLLSVFSLLPAATIIIPLLPLPIAPLPLLLPPLMLLLTILFAFAANLAMTLRTASAPLPPTTLLLLLPAHRHHHPLFPSSSPGAAVAASAADADADEPVPFDTAAVGSCPLFAAKSLAAEPMDTTHNTQMLSDSRGRTCKRTEAHLHTEPRPGVCVMPGMDREEGTGVACACCFGRGLIRPWSK